MPPVELIHFNPDRPIIGGVLGRLLPFRKSLNNFGDMLGPVVVHGLLRKAGIDIHEGKGSQRRLLTVGSILHFAKTGDVIWGTGRNGKVANEAHTFTNLDVRAVRGPLTREFLLKRGIHAPAIYGDPGLLVPHVMPELVETTKRPEHQFTYVPNYNDLKWAPKVDCLLDPRSPLENCLRTIAKSRFVVGTSLHAIIIAEALSIPARLIRSRIENEFKYQDYYLGTGRANFRVANDLNEALRLGGEAPPVFFQDMLLESFPYDLWK